MRFVDASVFVHAHHVHLNSKRRLKSHQVKIKKSAKKVVRRINDEPRITVVQVSDAVTKNCVGD